MFLRLMADLQEIHKEAKQVDDLFKYLSQWEKGKRLTHDFNLLLISYKSVIVTSNDSDVTKKREIRGGSKNQGEERARGG